MAAACPPQRALRLLYNLSFDESLVQHMISANLVPVLVREPLLLSPAGAKLMCSAQVKILAEVPPLRGVCLKLMYHLSTLEEGRGVFAYTDAVAMLMKLIIKFPAVWKAFHASIILLSSSQ